MPSHTRRAHSDTRHVEYHRASSPALAWLRIHAIKARIGVLVPTRSIRTVRPRVVRQSRSFARVAARPRYLASSKAPNADSARRACALEKGTSMTAVLAGCLVWVLVNCAWSSDVGYDDTLRRRTAASPPGVALQHCATTATSILVGLGIAGLLAPIAGAGELEISEMLIDVLACKAGVVAWIWLHLDATAARGRALATGPTTCALLCLAAVLMVASAFAV